MTLRYVTEEPCSKCAHVHPKDEACILQARCISCGRPLGLLTAEQADYTECKFCDQDAIRKYRAAARAINDVLDLRHRVLSHDTKAILREVAARMESRAEQIQAVWN